MMKPYIIKRIALTLLLIVAIGALLGLDVITGGQITDSFVDESSHHSDVLLDY